MDRAVNTPAGFKSRCAKLGEPGSARHLERLGNLSGAFAQQAAAMHPDAALEVRDMLMGAVEALPVPCEGGPPSEALVNLFGATQPLIAADLKDRPTRTDDPRWEKHASNMEAHQATFGRLDQLMRAHDPKDHNGFASKLMSSLYGEHANPLGVQFGVALCARTIASMPGDKAQVAERLKEFAGALAGPNGAKLVKSSDEIFLPPGFTSLMLGKVMQKHDIKTGDDPALDALKASAEAIAHERSF